MYVCMYVCKHACTCTHVCPPPCIHPHTPTPPHPHTPTLQVALQQLGSQLQSALLSFATSLTSNSTTATSGQVLQAVQGLASLTSAANQSSVTLVPAQGAQVRVDVREGVCLCERVWKCFVRGSEGVVVCNGVCVKTSRCVQQPDQHKPLIHNTPTHTSSHPHNPLTHTTPSHTNPPPHRVSYLQYVAWQTS